LYFIEFKDLNRVDLSNEMEYDKWKVQLFKKTLDCLQIANTFKYKTEWALKEYQPKCMSDNDYTFSLSDNFIFRMVIVVRFKAIYDYNSLLINLQSSILPYLKIFDYKPSMGLAPTILLIDFDKAKSIFPFIKEIPT